jgi:hypothetical protein
MIQMHSDTILYGKHVTIICFYALVYKNTLQTLSLVWVQVEPKEFYTNQTFLEERVNRISTGSMLESDGHYILMPKQKMVHNYLLHLMKKYSNLWRRKPNMIYFDG